VEKATEVTRKYDSGYTHYPDEGCVLADSCLNCPLPKCIEDIGLARFHREQRGPEVIRLYREGKTRDELAKIFKVSLRTIHRILESK